MLKVMRRGSRWVMWLIIIGVGAVFVLYLGLGGGFRGGNGPGTAVAVGSRRYDARDIDRVRSIQEDQIRRVAGKGFDPDSASAYLDQQALGAVMRMALLAQDAEEMGLAVGQGEMKAVVRTIPGAVDENGHMNSDGLRYFAERQYGSELRFEHWLRDDLLSQKVGRLLRSSVAVSDSEVRDLIRYQLEEVEIAAVRLGAGKPPTDLNVPDEAVQQILGSQAQRIRKAYDTRRSEFNQPEQVRARHILIKAPEGDTKARAAARKRILAIRKKIVDGADFGDVARQESEDSSKTKGGELGFFPRGRMVKPFEDVAFGLEPGVLSGVVETRYGFHLIQVEEKRPAQVVPFEEASERLARELAREDVWRKQAQAQGEALSKAIRSGASLIDAARAEKLTILRPDPLRRRPDGYIPQLGPQPEIMAAAFAMAKPGSDPTVHDSKSGFVLIQLLKRTEPSSKRVDALLSDRRQQLLLARQREVETAWLTDLHKRALDSGTLVMDASALQN